MQKKKKEAVAYYQKTNEYQLKEILDIYVTSYRKQSTYSIVPQNHCSFGILLITGIWALKILCPRNIDFDDKKQGGKCAFGTTLYTMISSVVIRFQV